ncbi:QWxxN domain [Candidatus Enterococcus mangumiae]|uniref:Uncharacterized protein n=1 Tax=Candidatus Enterococcus mangumiae TaxID=2230878 RepID=A0ABZ2T3Y7_9ENTE|nr:QWxxN domain [Enterococcus sp. DIV1094]MBO0490557.1 QWxxN domain [Enterococcus sp. DIV1094]
MPIEEHRKKTGLFNSKSRKHLTQKEQQRRLHLLAQILGHYPVGRGIWTPAGMLYLLSIGQNFRIVDANLPNRQRAVQETKAAFEVDTFVEARQQGEEISVQSLASSSTANPRRFVQPLPQNTPRNMTQTIQAPLPSNPLIYLVEKAHQWSIGIHKMAYSISHLENCTTTSEVFHQNSLGLFNGANQTQAHFKTVCQIAVAKAQKKNEQPIKVPAGFQKFHFTHRQNKNSTHLFTAEEAAVKMRKMFQATMGDFDQPVNLTTINQARKQVDQQDTPIIEAFWNEMTELFTSFFSQPENTTFTEQQADKNGYSVMDHFFEWMGQTFSVNLDTYDSTDKQTNEHFNNPRVTTPFDPLTTESAADKPDITEIEPGALAKLLELGNRLSKKFDDFIKKYDPLVGRGAEAAPVNSQPDRSAAAEHLQSSPVIFAKDSEYEQVIQIIDAISQNKRPAGNLSVLPNFRYDELLYDRKNQTASANVMLKTFFVDQNLLQSSANDLELIEVVQRWAGRNWGNEDNTQSQRAQYLAYLILESYGVEDVRIGEFLSNSQLQAIYKQWKTNTLLMGYPYKEVNEQSHIYHLSPAETPSVTRFLQQMKVNKQIYKDFIHERPASISKNTKIPPIYHQKQLFNMRAKTVEVNNVAQDFLSKQRIYLDQPTPAQLVIEMRKWILNGKRYEEIVRRQITAATMLRQAHGATEKPLTVSEARAILLQWEENNAQLGYVYQKTKKKNWGIDINKIKKEQEKEREKQVKQKIELFLRENGLSSSIKTPFQPEKTPEQQTTIENQEIIQQRVANFLTDKGIACNTTNPNLFAEAVSNWVLLEGATQKIIDMVKVKQIAQVILDEKLDGVISNEHAEITFVKWLWDLIETDESLLTVVPRPVSDEQIITSMPTSPAPMMNVMNQTETTIGEEAKNTTNNEQWRSAKVMKQVEAFFREKGLLVGEVTKEDVLSAMGKWFIESGERTSVMPEKIQAVASVILKELKLYGGAPEEVLSDASAEKTVMKWAFENVLGSSIEAYIAKNIVDVPDPSAFTLGHLRRLFTFEELKKTGRINFSSQQDSKASIDAERNLKRLWATLSNRALPHYLLKSSNLPDNLLISDYSSLTQLTGASLLADLGFSKKFNQTETRLLGEFFLETLSLKGVHHFEELSFLLTPALVTVAQLEPDKMRAALVNDNYIEVALTTFISYSQRGYFQLMKTQAILNDLTATYQQAVIDWRRKLALVDEVLAECNRLGIRVSMAAGQVYLAGGNPCPGQWTPPDLERWYTRLTKDVAESYHLLNQFLIQLSIQSIPQQELAFLFSPNSHIYAASAQFKSEVRQYDPPKNMRSVPPFLLYKQEELLDTKLNLNQTDLFVAKNGNEERWYALKRLDEGGYKFYRVDQDPFLYLIYGLMDRKDLWDGQFRKNGDKIRIGKKDYTFTTQVHMDKEYSHGEGNTTLANQISLEHKDVLYRQLYASGNEQTVATKVWDVLKHVIPFYDCVVGVSAHNAEEAVPNCLLDAVSLIPVLGQVTSFSMRFALGVAKSVVKSGLSTTLKTGTRFLPTLPELRGLFATAIRTFDPGVEMIIGGGQFILKRLVALKNEEFVSKELKAVLTKLDLLKKQQPDVTQNFVTARLSKDGPEVRVKRMQNNLYLKVNDLKNGDVSGKYFTLRGEQLREFEGPATFTPRQKVVIQRLSRSLDVDQIFVEEPNLYPKLYGEGKVYTYKKKDGQRISAIKMDGQIVPVHIQVLEKHGVRYDIFDGEKLLPVNFNGIEWYFEPVTSPVISKSVETEVTHRLNQFETLWDVATLSAPDERGLMWSAEGRSYIKINDRYIPLILLNKEENRYHLVKKDILEPLTVLRFDLNERSFRFETEREKLAFELQSHIRRAGTSDDLIPGTSSGSAGTSRETKSYPPLPNTPARWKEWNEFRQAEILVVEPLKRPVDRNVVCKKLSTFIPEPKIVVSLDEEKERKGISEAIAHMYHLQPVDYQTFSGLNPNKAPEYLQPFFKKVSEAFYEAIEYFQRTKERCIELLKLDKIAGTPEGQYAVEMFDMYQIKNREPYLREIFKRLLSVSEKGERFLRQSADWGFENIWIVSTKLEKNEARQAYYTKVEAIPRTSAFMMTRDPECRIIFIADTNHIDPDHLPNLQLAIDPKETLMHETAHVVSMAYDVVSGYPYVAKGFSKCGQDVRDQYFRRFEGFFKTRYFDSYVDQLADVQGSPMLSNEAVILAEKTDAMLSMNIQMLDAETLMIMIRDVAKGNKFNQRPKVFKRDVSSEQSEIKITGETFIAVALMKSGSFYTVEKSPELKVPQKQPDSTTLSPDSTTKTQQVNTKKANLKPATPKQSKKNQSKSKKGKPRIQKLVGFSTKASIFLNEGQRTTPVKQKRSELNLQYR